MDSRFAAHNAHLDDPQAFAVLDPHLRLLAKQPLIHLPALLDRLPVGKPGIYSIAGGRQIGKTTLLKQWMQRLLTREHIPPEDIAFFTGELVDDHHTLVRLLSSHLEGRTATQFVLLDEVGYIQGWDKGVKFVADAGLLENTVLVLTGSDTAFLQEARMRFPGRRGKEDVVDFHLHPLTFREGVCLKGALGSEEASLLDDQPEKASTELLKKLFDLFDAYLAHGGLLTAMNDIARDGAISPATSAVYSDWIRGDVLKRGKHEPYLREVLAAVIKRLGSRISWTNLAQDLSIDHPRTVSDYAALLASMDVLIIQGAVLEDKRVEAPKKPRKIHFADPFVFHAVRHWLSPVKNPWEEQIKPSVADPALSSRLAEAAAVSHVRRLYTTYYIKAEGEVDIAFVRDNAIHPVEVKWAGQLRPKDLKQVKKYPQARIWTRQASFQSFHGLPAEPLPAALWRLGS